MAKSKSKRRTMPTWKREDFWNRLHKCKVALVMHGLITDAESRKIHERMLKAVEREAQP